MAGTGTTRPREQIVAAMALGGLLLASLLVWFVVVLTSRTSDDVEGATGDPPASADPSDTDDATPPDDDADGSTSDGADSADTRDEADAPDDADPPDESDEQETSTVDLDGVCTVELDAEDAEELGPDPAPWEVPGCARAPIDPTGARPRWIVVLASLPDDGFAEADALARAEEHDGADGLLWSSFYPSLNPDLWVVFQGPFGGRDAATAAAERAGGGAYPRQLSEDG